MYFQIVRKPWKIQRETALPSQPASTLAADLGLLWNFERHTLNQVQPGPLGSSKAPQPILKAQVCLRALIGGLSLRAIGEDVKQAKPFKKMLPIRSNRLLKRIRLIRLFSEVDTAPLHDLRTSRRSHFSTGINSKHICNAN